MTTPNKTCPKDSKSLIALGCEPERPGMEAESRSRLEEWSSDARRAHSLQVAQG